MVLLLSSLLATRHSLFRDLLAVKLRLEADHELAAADIEHRPLDHRRLRQHQRDGLLLVDPGLVLVRQLAKRHAGAIEQSLPADPLAPLLQPLAIDAGGLVVMKRIVDAVLVEPGARLVHGLAVLDAVDGRGFGHSRLPHFGASILVGWRSKIIQSVWGWRPACRGTCRSDAEARAARSLLGLQASCQDVTRSQ